MLTKGTTRHPDHPTDRGPRFIDLTGQTFNHLTAIAYVESRVGGSVWEWLCSCGQKTLAYASNVKSGHTKSCGCWNARVRYKHGMSYSTEYCSWRHMLERCFNPKNKNYHRYGAIGITVCDKWRTDFSAFYGHIGPSPSPVHSVDRYPDKRGNYEPGNVRWAKPAEQNRNTSRNHLVTYKGETLCVRDWAQRVGISYQSLTIRLKRWSLERAMTEPRNNNHPRTSQI